jgi:hypothetical protein
MPAPICADCITKREETGDPMSWCSTHAREHQVRHAGARKSIPPTFNMR